MAEPKRKNLGRGLSALLGDAAPAMAPATEAATIAPGIGQRSLPVEALRPGRFQPRRVFDEQAINDLAASVKAKGVLQPILVRRDPANHDGYEIIAGERRWRAAQRAQLHEVPVIIRDFTDREALEVALVENLQRQDLSPLEEAEGYQRLMEEFEHTQEELARAVAKSRSHVANTMRLLGLPDAVKELVAAGRLTAGHARALLPADDPVALARQVVEKQLNVRQTEALAASAPGAKARNGAVRKGGAAKDADTALLERDLTASLGMKVSIRAMGRGGELVIHYGSLEQLDDVLARLAGKGR